MCWWSVCWAAAPKGTLSFFIINPWKTQVLLGPLRWQKKLEYWKRRVGAQKLFYVIHKKKMGNNSPSWAASLLLNTWINWDSHSPKDKSARYHHNSRLRQWQQGGRQSPPIWVFGNMDRGWAVPGMVFGGLGVGAHCPPQALMKCCASSPKCPEHNMLQQPRAGKWREISGNTQGKMCVLWVRLKHPHI